MDRQIKIDKKNMILLLIMTVFLLLETGIDKNLIKVINFVLGTLCWISIYMENKKVYNHELVIAKLFILSVPLSFVDMFGNSYGVTILSWFNIFLLVIGLTYIGRYLARGKVYFDHLALLSIVLIFVSLIPAIRGRNISGGITQYINIVVSFILIIIGSSFKYNLNDKEVNILKKDYVLATIITAIGLFIQIFSVHILKMRIGNYNLFGGYRHAFGFLFADYSFLSLYLVSGAMMLYFFKERDRYFGNRWIAYFIFLLLASIFTSARTGIVAFIVSFVIFNLGKIIDFIKKDFRKGIIIILAIILLILFSLLLFSEIRDTAIFSDSGRFKLNQRAFEIFLSSPLCGLGFGNSNYPGMLPHNLLFQYLAQGGILFTLPLIGFLLTLLWEAYRRDKNLVPTLICLLIGSLFIPNIFDSRFLPGLLFILSLAGMGKNTKAVSKLDKGKYKVKVWKEVTLKDLFFGLGKWAWLIIILCLVSISASGFISYFVLDKQYETFTTIRILDAKYSYYGKYSDLVRTDEVAEQVIKNLGLNMSHREYRTKVNASRIETSEKVKVEVIDKNPQLAADIANEIARVSRKEALKDRMWTMIVDLADPPRTPIRPIPMANMAIGGIFGLVVGIFIAFYKEFFNDRIR